MTLEEIRNTESYKNQKEVMSKLSTEQVHLMVSYLLLDQIYKWIDSYGNATEAFKIDETIMRDEIERRLYKKEEE